MTYIAMETGLLYVEMGCKRGTVELRVSVRVCRANSSLVHHS